MVHYFRLYYTELTPLRKVRQKKTLRLISYSTVVSFIKGVIPKYFQFKTL